MSFLKRGFTSIIKRKSRNIILFVILFVITNLVLSGFSMKSASKESAKLARQKLGATVTYEYDMQKAMNASREETSSSSYSNDKSKRTMPKSEPVSLETAKSIATSKYVQGYNFVNSTVVNSDGINPVEETTTDDSSDSDDNAPSDMPGGMKDEGNSKNMISADFTLKGVLNSDSDEDFYNGNSEITDGRALSDDDIDSNYILVEEELAYDNNLSVGSKVKLVSSDETVTTEFEVVGIYNTSDTSSSSQPGRQMMNAMSPYNKIYCSYKAAQTMKGDNSEGDDAIDSAIYYLNDPENIDAFKAEALKKGVDEDTYKLDANDDEYQQMIQPIENVASVSDKVVIIVAVAGIVVLTLVVVLFTKERTYEIGVLLSLGESKFKLLLQFFSELLIIGVVAFGISIFSGNVIAQKMADSLLANEANVTETGKTVPSNGPGGQGGPGGQQFSGKGGPDGQSNSKVETIDTIDVKVTGNDLAKLAGLGVVIIFLSTALTSVSIMRYKPKDILTSRD
ncbi:ABC transporter permease [Clostridium bornimense]|uniref:ABC transporter permease n=1 Tax=Clostridium bornimense TaxID=1216932 RepID=UPI001C1134A8|nr:ABC transporter permease [Clostridium bornimense]MBU5316948.1 ABC transporter permease [Clostridium bornimense]